MADVYYEVSNLTPTLWNSTANNLMTSSNKEDYWSSDSGYIPVFFVSQDFPENWSSLCTLSSVTITYQVKCEKQKTLHFGESLKLYGQVIGCNSIDDIKGLGPTFHLDSKSQGSGYSTSTKTFIYSSTAISDPYFNSTTTANYKYIGIAFQFVKGANNSVNAYLKDIKIGFKRKRACTILFQKTDSSRINSLRCDYGDSLKSIAEGYESQAISEGQFFTGWKSNLTNLEYKSENIPDAGEQDIIYKAQYDQLYSIIYKNGSDSLYEDTYGAREGYNYTLKLDTTIQSNGMQSLYKNKKFLGWSKSSTATSASYSSGGNLGTVSEDTILYAVWQERDSVTINPSVSDITTVVFDNIPDAQDGLTYYFDRGTNKKVTIEINTSATEGKEYYINSVTGATGTVIENGRRSWTGNDIANIGSTAVATTISVIYHKNLKFHLHNYFIELASFDPTTQLDTLTLTGHPIFSARTTNNYRDKYKVVYLNPGDNITLTGIMTDSHYYIARAHIPNTTNDMSDIWNGNYSNSSLEITNTTTVNRLILKNTYSGNNVSTSITDANYKNYSYTYTVPTGSDGLALMGDASTHKIEQGYIIYEPFHFSADIIINNPDGRLSIGRSTSLLQYCQYSTTSTGYFIQFFNDLNYQNLNIDNDLGITFNPSSTTSTDRITQLIVDDNLQDFKYYVLQNGEKKINNYVYIQSNESDSQEGYQLSRYRGLWISPDQDLIDNWAPAHSVTVSWSITDYKAFIILKLPESSDSDVDTTDTNNILDKISFSGSGWTNYTDLTENRNRLVYVQEITNVNTTSNINATLRDIAEQGYILKNIKYCYYSQDISSLQNSGTIIREQLDNNNNSDLPIGWNRTSPDATTGSNDKLEFNKAGTTNLPAGQVDYYFITYEEGLPIFYPDSESNPKRAIQLYWEGNRAIGLYYENTRLL